MERLGNHKILPALFVRYFIKTWRNTVYADADGRKGASNVEFPSACCFGARLLTRPAPPLLRAHRRFFNPRASSPPPQIFSREVSPRMCCAAVRRLFALSDHSKKHRTRAADSRRKAIHINLSRRAKSLTHIETMPSTSLNCFPLPLLGVL